MSVGVAIYTALIFAAVTLFIIIAGLLPWLIEMAADRTAEHAQTSDTGLVADAPGLPGSGRVLSDYIRGRIDADELELRLDVKYRPHLIAALVDQGRYDRMTVRRIAIENMGISRTLWQTMAPDDWDGSITIAGHRV